MGQHAKLIIKLNLLTLDVRSVCSGIMERVLRATLSFLLGILPSLRVCVRLANFLVWEGRF